MRLAVVRIGFCAFAKHGMPQQYMHDGRQHQPGVAGQHGVFAATGLQVVGITAMTCWVCCWVSFFHSSTRSGTRSRSGISRRTSVITSGASKAACSRSTVHSATARVSVTAASCGICAQSVRFRLRSSSALKMASLLSKWAYSPPLDRPQRWAMSSIRAAVKPRRENSCNAASSICGTRCAGARRNLRLG